MANATGDRVNTEQDLSGPTFLDLPAEIRNVIYQLALVRNEYFLIELNLHYSAERATTIALLRTTRQIHAEATPVFYGMNTFDGGYRSNKLLQWLSKLGTSRQHLRKLHVPYVTNQQQFKSALNLLKEAKNMETLVLGSGLLFSFIASAVGGSPPSRKKKRNFDIFVPWLRSMQRARRAREDQGPILDLLQISAPNRLCYTQNEIGEGSYQAAKASREAELTALRADLAKSLA